MGDIITASEIRGGESLDDVIDVLYGTDRDMKFFSFVNHLKEGASVNNTKVEWQDDQLRGKSLTITASASGADWDTDDDTTALPVSAADKAKLKVGDLIRLPTGPEVIRVTAINSANTIDATRGVAGTASAQGGTAFTGVKTGNAQEDGSSPIEPAPTDPTERYNYVQIIEDPYHVSAEIQMKHIGTSAERERQRMLSTKNAISELNSAIYWGRRYESSDIRAMGGLREWATVTSGVAGNITPAKIRTIVRTMIDAGGFPDKVHISPTDMAFFEVALANEKAVVREDNKAKMSVVKVVTMGDISLELIMDRDVLVGEAMFVDSSKLSLHAMAGNGIDGNFKSYEVDRNGKQLKDHTVGFYTIKVKNPAAALCRATGITGGATS